MASRNPTGSGLHWLNEPSIRSNRAVLQRLGYRRSEFRSLAQPVQGIGRGDAAGCMGAEVCLAALRCQKVADTFRRHLRKCGELLDGNIPAKIKIDPGFEPISMHVSRMCAHMSCYARLSIRLQAHQFNCYWIISAMLMA